MKQKLIKIYKKMSFPKTLLIISWLLGVILDEELMEVVSMVGVMIMWYIDNKERKPKDPNKELYKDLSLKCWAKIYEYETNPSEELEKEIIELDKQITELGEQIFNYNK